MMMGISREQALEEHRELWRWLAQDGTRTKNDYYRGRPADEQRYNDCPCCDYIWGLAANDEDVDACPECRNCPLEWPGGSCLACDGPFHDWEWHSGPNHPGYKTKDNNKAARAAAIIAEIPERPAPVEAAADPATPQW